MGIQLAWLGHSAFRVDTDHKRIYIDPFLSGNPKCPDSELEPERCDLIVLTHGHGVPCHYGTFGLLTGAPDQLRERAPSGVEILSQSLARH